MNLPTILTALLVFGIVAAIVIKMVRDKKAHKGGCSCGCSGCGNQAFCHSKN